MNQHQYARPLKNIHKIEQPTLISRRSKENDAIFDPKNLATVQKIWNLQLMLPWQPLGPLLKIKLVVGYM